MMVVVAVIIVVVFVVVLVLVLFFVWARQATYLPAYQSTERPRPPPAYSPLWPCSHSFGVKFDALQVVFSSSPREEQTKDYY